VDGVRVNTGAANPPDKFARFLGGASLLLAFVSAGTTGFLAYQSNGIQAKLLDVSAHVSLNLDQYDSDYSSHHKGPSFNLTIRISNAGPGTAEGMRIGVTIYGDPQQVKWSDLGARSLGPNQSAPPATVLVDASYLSGLPPVDPKYVLWVWVQYHDIPGKFWTATYDPTSGNNKGLSVSPSVVRTNPLLPPGG
jgi:hypothetical protein